MKRSLFCMLMAFAMTFLFASFEFEASAQSNNNGAEDFLSELRNELMAENDILNVTKVIPFGEYSSIYFGKIGEDEFIAINKFTNDSSQILLPNNFLAAVFEEGSYLYPKYVVDTVFKQNRDYLSNFESENMKTMTIDDGSWGITYWYEREIKSQLISNEVLSLGSFSLTLINSSLLFKFLIFIFVSRS